MIQTLARAVAVAVDLAGGGKSWWPLVSSNTCTEGDLTMTVKFSAMSCD